MPKLILLCMLLITLTSVGQNNLSGSPKGSPLTYVYKIKKEEAQTLYRSKLRKYTDRYLHTLVDSFRIDEPGLQPGNYIFASANRNRLESQLRAIGDVDYKIVNNNRDLVIALHNRQGKLLPGASVKMDGKRLRYDATTQTYRREKYKKGGLLQVEYDGVLYAYELKKEGRRQSAFLKRAWSGVKWLFSKKRERQHDFYYRTKHEQGFSGFFVCSQPRYKPGDSVRLKAFVTTKKGKPYNNKLLLRLSDRQFDTDTILTEITPYRPGAFEYSFVLTDSLDLDLDSDYLLTLEERSSRKYDLDEYDGDLDDEEYAAKRKVVMRGTFNLEEYELESITFSARSDKAVHSRGEEASVYLKASDENGLTVMDGRVELFVTTAPYGQKDFSPPRLFLPDTLWRHSQVLEPAGETKVLLPDSIFPKAGFTYNIECIFLNSNNERRTQTLHQKFQQAPARITFDLTGDSLHIDHLVKGISQPVEATLYAITGEDDSLSEHRVRLPATVRVHPLATLYEIETEDLNEEFNVTASPPVSAQSLRTADSVFVRLVNPSRLPVWYTLFAGNKVVQRGYGDDLLFEAKAVTRKNYFLSLQYLFYNKIHNQDYIVPFYDKLLSVNFVQPAAVYPGQTASISVVVNDAHGYPVADADVTAWSYTKKFTGGRPPSLPYFGRQYPGRKRYAKFREDEEMDFSTGTRLAWQRWSREMHLDTIEYYKFLHPEDLYINTEPAPDSLTQLAPFVVKGGEVVPVHQIYIDDLPVFFSAAEHLQRYSFAVSPGKHNLRLRTPTAMIWLDSITVTKGVKTFISIEAEATNLRIRMQKAPPNLMPYERTLWSRYMILLQNDFGNRYASVENGLQVFPLLPPSYRKPVWVGPLANQYADLVVKNGFTQRFETEGNYHYFISKGLIKQKQLPGVTSLPHTLSLTAKEQDFRDRVFTTKELDSLWQEFLYSRSASTELFYNPSLSKEGNGKLEIALDKTSNKENLFVRNTFLFRHDDPDYLRIYPGNRRDLGYVQPGLYRLLFLLKNDAYLIKDSLVVKENGINFYQVAVSDVRRKDSTSTRISAIVHEKEQFNYGQADFNAIKETFNSRYFDRSLLTETVSGLVRDKDGQPLAGISVMLKGSGIGALTNQQGEYVMQVPPDGTLVVGGVGFVAEEKKLKGSETVHFSLVKAKYNLDEVVVVGYGNSRQRSITGSVSVVDGYLSGKVPGVMIRGINSIDGNNAPLLIIDGLPYAGKLDDLAPSLIVTTNVLKGEAATAIYGAQAAGGVVIITTKGAKLNAAETPGGDGPVASSLRQHFRDYAYWQPRLKTDLAGKATFTVTYPDDITAWRSFAMVMGNDRQTGSAEGLVRSYKAISGNLALPQFAVTSDSITTIGKALNYGMDTLEVKRHFYVNDQLLHHRLLRFRNAWIDTFAVVAPAGDSLKLKYTVQKEDGYLDGEERSLPLFAPGVVETTGFFAALPKDTSFILQAFPDTGMVTIYAESSVLPTLEKEVESLRTYEYLCNEQIASKLKALLVQKRIDSFLKRPFRYDKNIRELIGKLSQGKSTTGLWGWWPNTDPMIWVSLHAVEALVEAGKQGYAVSLNKPALVDYLLLTLEKWGRTDKLSALRLLQMLDARADYKRYTDSLERHLPNMNLYEKLRFAEIKQVAGLNYTLDSMLVRRSETMFGSVYWGEEGYRFFDNAIQNSLLMYRLLKNGGNQSDLLEKLRGYFLEKRRTGHWRNTYESSLILETILPDLLVNDSLPKASMLTLSGTTESTINRFPFSTEIRGIAPITIKKEGSQPVYFTTYHQRWNTAPKKVAGEFTVNTAFVKNNQPLTILKAGEPVELKIDVAVKSEAQYVMIEVPIPAGCSYKEKAQGHRNNEVHREYFKNKVSIFCSSLKKGEYTFTVSLLPRYTGRYTLNPAKAEMMYFPVFYGREEIRKVRIE